MDKMRNMAYMAIGALLMAGYQKYNGVIKETMRDTMQMEKEMAKDMLENMM